MKPDNGDAFRTYQSSDMMKKDYYDVLEWIYSIVQVPKSLELKGDLVSE
ncbi:MAG: hypothetical protein ACXADF_16835 [Candidatus Thorarchaeota archaeon]